MAEAAYEKLRIVMALIGLVLLMSTAATYSPPQTRAGLVILGVFLLFLSSELKVWLLRGRVERVERAQERYQAVLDSRLAAYDYDSRVLKPDSEELASCLHDFARMKADLGMKDDAERLYRRALDAWEKACGPESAEVAGCLTNLGLLCDNAKRFEDAEPLLHRALAIREKVLGREHPEVGFACANLATHYLAKGNRDVAEHFRERWRERRA